MCGREVGTFAHYTITKRLPSIVQVILEENPFPAATVARLEALAAEIPAAPIRPLDLGAAPDASDWRAYVAPYVGQNWLETPALFVETYFYRRILEATGYFHVSSGTGHDPYAAQKHRSLDATRAAIGLLCDYAEDLFHSHVDWESAVASLLAVALWGNKADLSLRPVPGGSTEAHTTSHLTAGTIDRQEAYLLADEAPAVAAYLADLQPKAVRVDILVDNAGLELTSDLCLADFLLRTNLAHHVFLHLKAHPTFVSDATIPDVWQTVLCLAHDPCPTVRQFARRIQRYVERRRLRLCSDPFWTAPLRMWQMPPPLWQALRTSDVLISKGDMHYRRLLGDYCWPFTTPFAAIVAYTPAPLVALRTLKAELATGLAPGQRESLDRLDPAWLTAGRWGVIQFAPGRQRYFF